MVQKITYSTQEILDAYDNTADHSIAEPKALAAALRMLIKQHNEYVDGGCGPTVVFCYDIWEVIDELEGTETAAMTALKRLYNSNDEGMKLLAEYEAFENIEKLFEDLHNE